LPDRHKIHKADAAGEPHFRFLKQEAADIAGFRSPPSAGLSGNSPLQNASTINNDEISKA
jgi:hypothetical protein